MITYLDLPNGTYRANNPQELESHDMGFGVVFKKITLDIVGHGPVMFPVNTASWKMQGWKQARGQTPDAQVEFNITLGAKMLRIFRRTGKTFQIRDVQVRAAGTRTSA